MAAVWWQGTTGADDEEYEVADDEVFEIVHRDRDRVPSLIAALAATAPPGALSYIGTSVVEDLTFEVEQGDLAGVEALRLVLESELSPEELFVVLSGAWAHLLEPLDRLRGTPFSPSQLAWLFDSLAPNRSPNVGQTIIDGDGLRFLPEQTPWQAELALRYPQHHN